jgi:hypothetical protein
LSPSAAHRQELDQRATAQREELDCLQILMARHNAKMIAIGDSGQLVSVQAGGRRLAPDRPHRWIDAAISTLAPSIEAYERSRSGWLGWWERSSCRWSVVIQVGNNRAARVASVASADRFRG